MPPTPSGEEGLGLLWTCTAQDGRGVREHHAACPPYVRSASTQHSGEGVLNCKTAAPVKQPSYVHQTTLDKSLPSPRLDLNPKQSNKPRPLHQVRRPGELTNAL